MFVQRSVVILWSSIPGTRPGVLLPRDSSSAIQSTVGAESMNGAFIQGQDPLTASTARRGRRPDETFQSDVPKYASIDDTPKTVLWEDIELFYLRNPDGGRDVLAAIINFRNLKGRPEGADR
jgi:hypothetical protein